MSELKEDFIPVKTIEVWEKNFGRNLILYPSYILNETGATIWHLCDGERNIREIVSTICSRFDTSHLPQSKVAEDVVSFLRELQRIGFIKFLERKKSGGKE